MSTLSKGDFGGHGHKRIADDIEMMVHMHSVVTSTLANRAFVLGRKIPQVMESLAPLLASPDTTRDAFTKVVELVRADGYEVKVEEMAPFNTHLTVMKDTVVLVVSLGVIPGFPGVLALFKSATKGGESDKNNEGGESEGDGGESEGGEYMSVYVALVNLFNKPDNPCEEPYAKAKELLEETSRPPLDIATLIATVMCALAV